MPDSISISEVTIRVVPTADRSFIGFASCLINGCLKLDNMKVTRDPKGRLRVLCPRANDKQHYHYHPTNAIARRAIEDAVSAELARLAALTNGGR